MYLLCHPTLAGRLWLSISQHNSHFYISNTFSLQELEFLKDSDVISPALYDQLLSKLPARHDSSQGPIEPFELNSQNEKALTSFNTPPPASAAPPSYAPPASQTPQQEVAEALYNYNPSGPTDLALYQGQHITILEKLNNDWWRGQDVNSQREGIFPSNYVRIISGGAPGNDVAMRNNNYYPPPQQQQQPQYNNNVYYPPPQQSQPQFPPPSTNYYAPPQQVVQQPPQQVVQQAPQQVQEQPQSSGGNNAIADGAKKVGSKLGNAAIFGAGATIGSNIVNSIF